MIRTFTILIASALFFHLSIKGQDYQKSDSIQHYASKLSGKWEYKGILQDGEYIDSTNSYSTDGITTIEVLIDSGYVIYKYLDDSLISKSFSSKIKVLELNFDKNRSNLYDEYSIMKNDSFITITTCQPIPTLDFQNGKCIMILTGMAGESVVKVTISGPFLFLESEYEIRKYIKIE